MAKISARGAHELARHVSPHGTAYLLRSDGQILYKLSIPGDGWKTHFRVKASTPAEMVAEFRALMAAHYSDAERNG